MSDKRNERLRIKNIHKLFDEDHFSTLNEILVDAIASPRVLKVQLTPQKFSRGNKRFQKRTPRPSLDVRGVMTISNRSTGPQRSLPS